MSDPAPAQVFELSITASGVVTSTAGEPVPDNNTDDEESPSWP